MFPSHGAYHKSCVDVGYYREVTKHFFLSLIFVTFFCVVIFDWCLFFSFFLVEVGLRGERWLQCLGLRRRAVVWNLCPRVTGTKFSLSKRCVISAN